MAIVVRARLERPGNEPTRLAVDLPLPETVVIPVLVDRSKDEPRGEFIPLRYVDVEFTLCYFDGRTPVYVAG